MELLHDIYTVDYENDQEHKENHVDDQSHLSGVKQPHQEEWRDMEEKQLADKKVETVNTLLFHDIHSFVHRVGTILAS